MKTMLISQMPFLDVEVSNRTISVASLVEAGCLDRTKDPWGVEERPPNENNDNAICSRGGSKIFECGEGG